MGVEGLNFDEKAKLLQSMTSKPKKARTPMDEYVIGLMSEDVSNYYKEQVKERAPKEPSVRYETPASEKSLQEEIEKFHMEELPEEVELEATPEDIEKYKEMGITISEHEEKLHEIEQAEEAKAKIPISTKKMLGRPPTSTVNVEEKKLGPRSVTREEAIEKGFDPEQVRQEGPGVSHKPEWFGEEEGYTVTRRGGKTAQEEIKEIPTEETVYYTDYELRIMEELANPKSELSKKLNKMMPKFINLPTEGVKRMSEGYKKMVGRFRGMSLQTIMQDEYGQDLIAAVASGADPATKMILFKALEDSGYISKEKRKEYNKQLREEISTIDRGYFRGRPIRPLEKKKKQGPGEEAPKATPFTGPTIKKKLKKEELESSRVLSWKFPKDSGKYTGKTLGESYAEIRSLPGDEQVDAKEELENFLAVQYTNVWLAYLKHAKLAKWPEDKRDERIRQEKSRVKHLKGWTDDSILDEPLDGAEEAYAVRRFAELTDKDPNITISQLAIIAWDEHLNGRPGLSKFLPKFYAEQYKPKEDGVEMSREFGEYISNYRRESDHFNKLNVLNEQQSNTLSMKLINTPHSWWTDMTLHEAFAEGKRKDEEENTPNNTFELEQYLNKVYPAEYKKYLQANAQIKNENRLRRDVSKKITQLETSVKEDEQPIIKRETIEEADLVPAQIIPGKTDSKGQPLYQEISQAAFDALPKMNKRMVSRNTLDEQAAEAASVKQEQVEKQEEEIVSGHPTMEMEEEDFTEKMRQLQEDLEYTESELEKPSQEKEATMRKRSDAGPGPITYNAPGKDDKKDYDYRERNKQPARGMNQFNIARMYSTTSSDDNGYIIMDIGWEPELFEGMSPQNVQHQIISYIKGLESDKYLHDFGVMGKPKVTDFDQDAGVARVKVRCSESRGIMTMTYAGDEEKDALPLVG